MTTAAQAKAAGTALLKSQMVTPSPVYEMLSPPNCCARPTVRRRKRTVQQNKSLGRMVDFF
jgi:hypothetical protein